MRKLSAFSRKPISKKLDKESLLDNDLGVETRDEKKLLRSNSSKVKTRVLERKSTKNVEKSNEQRTQRRKSMVSKRSDFVLDRGDHSPLREGGWVKLSDDELSLGGDRTPPSSEDASDHESAEPKQMRPKREKVKGQRKDDKRTRSSSTTSGREANPLARTRRVTKLKREVRPSATSDRESPGLLDILPIELKEDARDAKAKKFKAKAEKLHAKYCGRGKPDEACEYIFSAAMQHIKGAEEPTFTVQMLHACKDMLAALAGDPKSNLADYLQTALGAMKDWLGALKDPRDPTFLQLVDVISTIAGAKDAKLAALAALAALKGISDMVSGAAAEPLMVAQAAIFEALMQAHAELPVNLPMWKEQIDLISNLRRWIERPGSPISSEVKDRWRAVMGELQNRQFELNPLAEIDRLLNETTESE